MKEKLTNSNLDKIFRDSIDNMETQPSEAFWVKASEDYLFKSNLAGQKALGRWKVTAAALGAAVILLSAYIIYMQSQISNINNRLAITEKKTGIHTNTARLSLNEKRIQSVFVQPQKIQNNKNKGTIISLAIKSKTHRAEITSVSEESINKPGGFNGSTANSKKYNRFSIANTVAKPGTFKNSDASNLHNDEVTQTNIAAAGSPNDVEYLNAKSNTTLPQFNNSAVSITDNIIPVENYVRPLGSNILSRLSLSVFYEPYISDELLENESSDIITVNNVSANEEEVHPYMAGLRMGYDISKHWTISTGFLFYNFNVSVSPTTIYAQKQQDGTIGYSFQTSIGTVACPTPVNASVGNYMIVSGEELANYISIPLHVKYNFFTHTRWGFYIDAGVMINIAVLREMNVSWQEYNSLSGNSTEGINNSQKVYGSYYFAPGISYQLFNKISIFFEPSLEGSAVYSIALNTTPYLGLGAGVTCHL